MGVIQVYCRDQNGTPLGGVGLQLFITPSFPPYVPHLADTKVSGSDGNATLDSMQLFCPFALWAIHASYPSASNPNQVLTGVFTDPRCQAPQQDFTFQVTGPPPPITCVSNSNCPPGYVCLNGICTPGNPPCSSLNPCPQGFNCVNGQCVPVSGCTTNNDCPVGYRCVNGSCVSTSNGGGTGMWIVAGLAIILGVAVIAGAQEGELF